MKIENKLLDLKSRAGIRIVIRIKKNKVFNKNVKRFSPAKKKLNF